MIRSKGLGLGRPIRVQIAGGVGGFAAKGKARAQASVTYRNKLRVARCCVGAAVSEFRVLLWPPVVQA